MSSDRLGPSQQLCHRERREGPAPGSVEMDVAVGTDEYSIYSTAGVCL